MTVTKCQVDWREYFLAFCDRHGPPVNFNEHRLLFQDGWQYSKYSHSGPEYPPPEDKGYLKQLQLIYWKIRKHNIEEVLRKGEQQLAGLKLLEETHDGPIYVITKQRDEETGKITTQRDTVDLVKLEAELKILDEEFANCWSYINELQASLMPVM